METGQASLGNLSLYCARASSHCSLPILSGASGIFHSFYRWNGADISEFISFRNYIDLLKSPDFWQSFRVALLLGLWNVVKTIPAIAVAVWIHRCSSERVQNVYRLLFVVPMVIPALVVALIWRSFFFEATQDYLNHSLRRPVCLLFFAGSTRYSDGAASFSRVPGPHGLAIRA
jgi:ABC-type sugar transport system permease subunit